jgi:hypothetical protein
MCEQWKNVPPPRDPIYFLDSVTSIEEPREQCTVVFVLILRNRLRVCLGGGRGAAIPKARGLAQLGGPPGWLEEIDPAGCDFVHDGPSTPLHLPQLG